MSASARFNDSSSDDEGQGGGGVGEFRSSIQLPKLQSKKPKKSIGKVPGKKAVRFPDIHTNRDTIISRNSSTTNNLSDDEFQLPESSQIDMNLPKFGFNPQDIVSPQDSHQDSNHELDELDSDSSARNIADSEAKFSDSSSDDDDDEHSPVKNVFDNENDPENLNPEKNNHNGNRDGHRNVNRDHDRDTTPTHEININDQPSFKKSSSIHGSFRRGSSQSSHSKGSMQTSNNDSGGNGTGSKLKGILRKISLADQNYVPGYGNDNQPSQSDSFMGKIFSIAGDSGGLSGGGLAPGASKMTNNIPELDEEQAVGMDDGIELRRLSIDDLNETAKNLISQHVQLEPTSNISSAVNSDVEDIFHGDHDSDSGLLNNDDLYVNRDVQNDLSLQDEFMLDDKDYVAPPTKVHAGVLSSLLQLYQNPNAQQSASSLSTSKFDDETLYSRGTSTNDYTKDPKLSTSKFASRVLNKMHRKQKHARETSNNTDNDSGSSFDKDDNGNNLPSFQNAKPRAPKKESNKTSSKISRLKKLKKKQQLKITVHIGDILQKQNFIMKMCRALMIFGAPTHRLEEYMIMTSRVLEIDGQFMYFPGCMLISFGDAATRTSEVHLVRCNQGLNLSKLSDTHKIYKQVIHDLIGAEKASEKLDDLMKSPNLRAPWLCVLIYGLGSACVCPFAFSGGWVDIPIAFAVGLCVGYLQFFVSSMSNLYSSVFEVSASIVVSFIARAIGSIRGGDLFCFSAIAQGSLALILPGYIILCGSLELQSRNLVAGAVRMFYAIIYSLFLGFGITLGAALYGWIDKNAVSGEKAKTCQHPLDDKFKILFVPLFSASLGLINQARIRQLPVMLVIACTGYVGTFFAGKHFSSVTEFTACIGAFIVGILGNCYSRIWKGMAVSAMLPAIFVQVPSGIASQSTLVSGIANADKITNSSATVDTSSVNSLSFGATMVQVSIGISVGLFAAALVVYPFGKKRTGLFAL